MRAEMLLERACDRAGDIMDELLEPLRGTPDYDEFVDETDDMTRYTDKGQRLFDSIYDDVEAELLQQLN